MLPFDFLKKEIGFLESSICKAETSTENDLNQQVCRCSLSVSIGEEFLDALQQIQKAGMVPMWVLL